MARRFFVPRALIGALLVAFVSSATAHAQADAPRRANVPSDAARLANNTFAWSLYDQLRSKPGNVFVSPFSISSAMGMMLAGADGKTRDQMRAVLGVTGSDALYHQGMSDIAAALGNAKHAEITVANRVWAQTGLALHKPFLQTVTGTYRSGIALFDFSRDYARAHTVVNGWVAKQTRNKIKDLFKPGDIKASTHMVLANAIYFKGKWRTAFDKKHTRKRAFWLDGSRSVQVPLMHRTHEGGISYEKRKGYALLDLPYKGYEVTMTIALPDARDGLGALEKRIATEGLQPRSMAQLVNIALPKFTFDRRIQLAAVLSRMGMSTAFDPGTANFGKLADNGHYIDKVIHKAFVSVDEEGTVAAAATGVTVAPTSAAPSRPVDFIVDRPFLFAIKDSRTRAILFLGRVADPRK